jgi:hypothetical protein
MRQQEEYTATGMVGGMAVAAVCVAAVAMVFRQWEQRRRHFWRGHEKIMHWAPQDVCAQLRLIPVQFPDFVVEDMEGLCDIVKRKHLTGVTLLQIGTLGPERLGLQDLSPAQLRVLLAAVPTFLKFVTSEMQK